MSSATLVSEMGWLPLSLTALVLVLAIANVSPAGTALSALRNTMLLICAAIASLAIWLMWALVLR